MNLSDLDAVASTPDVGDTDPAGQSMQRFWPVTLTLKKADLVNALSDYVGLNKREAKDMVDTFFEVMCTALESGENLRLSGFGNFRLRDKAPRPGRNPNTGNTMPLAARRVVTFRPSQKLSSLANARTGRRSGQ